MTKDTGLSPCGGSSLAATIYPGVGLDGLVAVLSSRRAPRPIAPSPAVPISTMWTIILSIFCDSTTKIT